MDQDNITGYLEDVVKTKKLLFEDAMNLIDALLKEIYLTLISRLKIESIEVFTASIGRFGQDGILALLFENAPCHLCRLSVGRAHHEKC